jgi:hypothetical protein
MFCPNPQCGEEIRTPEIECVVCGTFLGYPNVRVAASSSETTALSERYANAEADAAKRGCENVFQAFVGAILTSKAVICRPLKIVAQFVLSDDPLYSTYYKGVGRDRRIDLSTVDDDRRATDVLLFPSYYDQIVFAALSLDGVGTKDYGTCSLVLKDMAVESRASVFEKNSVTFCKEAALGVGRPVPAGHRAPWADRHKLAGAKLGARLDSGTPTRSFPRILLSQSSKKGESDFVEVHIYGPIHRRALEGARLARPRPGNDADLALTIEIENALEEVGAEVKIG